MDAIGEVSGRLEAKAASFVKQNRLPGAAVGVVEGDRLAWWAPVGFADIASRRAPETSTLYRIASITKTFTGTAIMQLRDEGKLHLDDPAVRHIPELRDAESRFGDIETVTIRRMLSHESGLVSEPPGTDWRKAIYEGRIAVSLGRVSEIRTALPPNAQQKYSNLAFQLLGEIIARASGMPYIDYIRANILDPLGMTNTWFEPLSPDIAARCATGYAGRFVSDQLDLAPTAPTIWAEGGLWSCVDDLARWISFQLREDGGPRQGAQVLAGATLREMHVARYLGNEQWTEAWCIAWYATRRGEVIWTHHSGGLPGFSSDACFRPQDGIGAIVLINGTGDAITLALDLADIARSATAARAPRIDAPPRMPEAYASLIGVYGAPTTGALIRLEWRDGRLTFVDPSTPEWRPTLSATGDPDVFTVDAGVRQSGENVVFNRLADGRVRSVYIAAGTWDRFDIATSEAELAHP